MHFVTLPKKLVALFVTVAVLLALTACGTGATGGVPGAPATQPTASSALTAAPIQTSAGGALEPTSAGGLPAPTSTGGPVRDQVSLFDALRKAGATAAIGDPIEQPFLSVKGMQLTVNGADVQVFEYPDEAAAQADASKLADMLAGKGTAMVTWVAAPHAYGPGA